MTLRNRVVPFLLICSAILNAQDRGTITGAVVDTSGAIDRITELMFARLRTPERTRVSRLEVCPSRPRRSS